MFGKDFTSNDQFYDTANETFYHGLVLGLCAMMDNRYRISSNREAGYGRFDIQMLPFDEKLPGILLELKTQKDCGEEKMNELAIRALEQMENRMYGVEMKALGVKQILKYGIAFSGKQVAIKWVFDGNWHP